MTAPQMTLNDAIPACVKLAETIHSGRTNVRELDRAAVTIAAAILIGCVCLSAAFEGGKE